MESTLHKPALVAARTTPKAMTIVYWIVTALFCLEMSFTAYYELLRLPQAAEAFTRLGFPAGYFRHRALVGQAPRACVAAARPWFPRGSRSGPTPASPSTSSRRSSPTSRWAMARRRWARRRSPACSGGSRTTSGDRRQASPVSA